ncbi:MAG: Hint domain-containing protein [Roseobacter sp.]
MSGYLFSGNVPDDLKYVQALRPFILACDFLSQNQIGSHGTEIDQGQIVFEGHDCLSSLDGSHVSISRWKPDRVLGAYLPADPLQSFKAGSRSGPDRIGAVQTPHPKEGYAKQIGKIRNTGLSRFGPGTMIVTENGEIPVEWLAVGDRVLTRDHGFQPVQEVVRTKLAQVHFNNHPNECPICIPAGTLGAGCPTHDLFLAAQHGVLVRSSVTEKRIASREVFAPANAWSDIGVAKTITPDGDFMMTDVIFSSHEVILAHGAWVESTIVDGKRAALRSIKSGVLIADSTGIDKNRMQSARLRLSRKQTVTLLANEMRFAAGVDQENAIIRSA